MSSISGGVAVRSACLAAALLCAGCADVQAVEIQCPSALDETPAVKSNVAGWDTVAEGAKRPLDQVGLYLFHPSKKSSLVPDATRRGKSEEVVNWQLVRGPNDEFWVACSYVGTSALLVKKLEPAISQCAATYELLPNGNRLRLRGMTCK
jgi:hypothetical protein